MTVKGLRAIQPGMTVQQVTRVFGGAGTRVGGAEVRNATYRWQRGDAFVMISFVDGAARSAFQAGLSDAAQRNAPPVTWAQFDGLTAGMTVEEVVHILGSEGRYTGFVDAGGSVTRGYAWRGGAPGSTLIATFRDGRLESKTEAGLESAAPAQPPSGAGAGTLGVTPEGLRAVQPGMTVEQVQHILGGPTAQMATSDLGGRRSETYRWEAGGESIMISFIDGRAAVATQTGLETAVQRRAPPVTLAQFERLAEGMTYGEVVRILGSEGRYAGFTDAGGYVSHGYTWRGHSLGALLSVSFHQGRLTGKTQTGLR